MKVLDPGHRYALDDLKSGGTTILQFMKDPKIHGEGMSGPSCQEVLRAVIDRVKTLDKECPDVENALILYHGRMMLAAFEARALRRHFEKHGTEVELLPVGADGHLAITFGGE